MFHCGLQKTGSTHLQRHVFPHMTHGTYVTVSRFRDIVDAVAAAPRPILISDENLSGSPVSGSYCDVRERLLRGVAQAYPGSRLLLVLREPSAHLESLYHQHVMKGGTERFPVWLEQANVLDAMDLNTLIDAIDDMEFSAVLLLDYDQLREDFGGAAGLVERFVGTRFDGSQERPSSRSNVSLKRAAARTIRVVNRFIDSPRNPRGRVNSAVMRILRVARLHPVDMMHRWPGRYLNRWGRPAIEPVELAELQEHFESSWVRARQRIREGHRPWLP